MLWGQSTAVGHHWSVTEGKASDDCKSLNFYEARALNIVPLPEQRAVELLSRVLPDQIQRYLYTGTLPAVGGTTGSTYLIRRSEGVIQIEGDSHASYYFCIHCASYKLPPTDEVLALWLMITHNELHFLETANRSKFREDDIVSQEVDVVNYSIRNWEDVPRYHPPEQTETIVIDPDEFGDIQVIDHSERDPAFVFDRMPPQQPDVDRNALVSYSIRFGSSFLFMLEQYGCSPIPILNGEGKYVIQGLASFLFYLDDVDTDMPHYQTPNGPTVAPCVDWPSGRDLDDACLLQLLSAYAQFVGPYEYPGEAGENAPRPIPRPMMPFTKCVMSLDSYRTLTGNMIDEPYGEMRWRNLPVLVDDRCGEFIFYLPDARDLGVIARHGNRFGLAVLERDNIRVEHLWQKRLFTTSHEMAVECLYGGFPDRQYRAMKYDIFKFSYDTDAKLEDNPELLSEMYEWRTWPQGHVLRDMAEDIGPEMCLDFDADPNQWAEGIFDERMKELQFADDF